MNDPGETWYWFEGMLYGPDGQRIIQSKNGAHRWLLERSRPTTLLFQPPP